MANLCNWHEWAAQLHCECANQWFGECVSLVCPGAWTIDTGADGEPLMAVIGGTRSFTESESNVRICVFTQDWIFQQCDLVRNGEIIDVLCGLEVHWVDPKGREQIWDVTTENVEQQWRRWDRYEHCIRVHSKRCEIVEAV